MTIISMITMNSIPHILTYDNFILSFAVYYFFKGGLWTVDCR